MLFGPYSINAGLLDCEKGSGWHPFTKYPRLSFWSAEITFHSIAYKHWRMDSYGNIWARCQGHMSDVLTFHPPQKITLWMLGYNAVLTVPPESYYTSYWRISPCSLQCYIYKKLLCKLDKTSTKLCLLTQFKYLYFDVLSTLVVLSIERCAF